MRFSPGEQAGICSLTKMRPAEEWKSADADLLVAYGVWLLAAFSLSARRRYYTTLACSCRWYGFSLYHMAPGSSAVRERAATILQEKSQTWFEAREAVYCIAQRMNSISFMTRRAGVLFVETSICCSSRASLGFLCDMASSHGRFRSLPTHSSSTILTS